MSNAGGMSTVTRYVDMLAGNTTWNPWEPAGAYDALATVTLSSATNTVTFAGIPAGYKHLQLRILNKITTGGINPTIRFNGDTGSNYIAHQLYGDGASAGSFSFGTGTAIGTSYASDQWGGQVIDILDYASTSKNKTVRTLGGTDKNGSGYVGLTSGLWFATPAAINSIDIIAASTTFTEFSQFALFGVK